ncbi:23837_t:CDS:2 [Cetraspora pellucida]|uniref:23837_t:CDS:1 n=1 Tax=Cetraspora pellucida TaxID=1433469 RepID=A0A9N8ZUX0_9GLOM|nr:23837_t:CDS:2 [Cetraspora pellucida]
MLRPPPSEILYEIFKHFENDPDYLHSCVLVNRAWCANAVQILWNKPFHLLLSRNLDSSHYLISTYLSCLSPDERHNLDLLTFPQTYSLSSSFSFIISKSYSSPTFSYPSFLRHLAYYPLAASVQDWCIINNLNTSENNPIMQKIIHALFRLFAKYSPGLDSLSFVMDMDIDIKHGLNYFDLKLNYHVSTLRDQSVRKWVGSVKEIEVAGDFAYDQDFTTLMQICRHLKKMEVRLPEFEYREDDDHYDTSAVLSARFIESQFELKHFCLRECHYPQALGIALLRQKNTLRHIKFRDIVFDKSCPLDWLPICQNLEILEFIDSESLIPNVLDPLRLAPLTNLRSITFKEDPVPAETLQSLILASQQNLEEILFGWPEDCRQEGYAQILNSISMNCPNLVRLGAMIGSNEIGELFGILNNCKKLKTLYIYGNGRSFDLNNILPEIGKFLPSTLIELNISARWRFGPDSLKQFLKNCCISFDKREKAVPLKRLVIRICDFINDEHLRILVRHSMKSLKFITLWHKKFFVNEAGIDKASQWLRKSVI